MIKGKIITLRVVRESDINTLYKYHQDITNRGDYFPIGILAAPVFKKKFQETGFWQKDEGMMLIVDKEDTIVGHIEFYPTVSYLDEIELSYHIYSNEYRGKGVATEAVNLFTTYLFDRFKHNRIRLIIHPDNLASKRVAQKCGYKSEGISRGAWYHRGKNQDVEVFAKIREDL